VLLADRSDLGEELVRLEGHLVSFSAIVTGEGPHGKRFEFLLQEIGRELNTLGAKSRDLELTRRVMAGKIAAEKLREQIQNVE
jgi:uncharacterized protein (TIGR00255 family)